MPIVYCSEHFESLTEYTSAEILGRNCRFLQTPFQGQEVKGDSTLRGNVEMNVLQSNEKARAEFRQKIAAREEAQVQLVNYKKGGTKFVNLVTMIPITWDEGQESSRLWKRYIVGFQADIESC
jgi:hypothetical protein